MAQVVLQDVTKRYPGSITAVRDLQLTVADGRLMVLLGPSGCGKTTTLRLIAGLEEPDAGAVRIGGRDVTRVQPRERNVAMVFQDSALYPHMNVRRNLAFALKIRGLSRPDIDRRVLETAELLDIAHLLDRRPATLSGGELQRVALGRAVARRPQVLLLDEPLSDLDERLRLALRAELKALQRRVGTTTIHVTHDQQEATAIADRIAVMFDGRIHQVDEPEAIHRRPADRLVAGFVGSPPMNFLDGGIERAGEEEVFVCDDGRIVLPSGAVQRAKGKSAVTLGVRPQHLRVVASDGAAEEGAVRCRVTLTERFGEQTFVHARTEGGSSLIAVLDSAHHCKPGDRIALRPDPGHLHIFERDSGSRIDRSQAPTRPAIA